MEDVVDSAAYSFPAEEEKILAWWDEVDAFNEQLRRREGGPPFTFYDGPPFATGLPHYGHLLAGTIKDIVTRFAASTGHAVPRRFGWDCHGLPVEFEVDKALGVKSKEDVHAMGIGTYNEACRSIVMRYSNEWRATVRRIGRWIDFDAGYKTLDTPYMETVWWVFKALHEKGLVYRGFKVMPYSTACCTPLSNFEAGLNYRDVSDPAVMVAFPVDGDPDGASLVAWTTTPWTLPSNLALCVHPELVYVRARCRATGRVFIVAESRLGALPGGGGVAKEGGGGEGKKGGGGGGDKKKKDKKKEGGGGGAAAAPPPAADAAPAAPAPPAKPTGYDILSTCVGADLAGATYEPLFPYFAHLKAKKEEADEVEGATKCTTRRPRGAFRVLADPYVTSDSGTGVVHCAPAFGEDDMRVCAAGRVCHVAGGDELPCPVDDDGRFTAAAPDFVGTHVKEADKAVLAAVKAAGRLVDSASIVHSYPYCWRSDTPLIYKAVPSWFVRVESLRDRLLANTASTTWVPAYVKEKRFHNWLEAARDWAVSRSRFWGTPLPVWASADGAEIVVIGSVAELEEKAGLAPGTVTDLHRHHVDGITIPSPSGRPDPLRRVEDVFDCWFESGAMPYAQAHFPFENAGAFPPLAGEAGVVSGAPPPDTPPLPSVFPADFVAEGLDQTRGWFYTLMVLSTALFDAPAFKNLVCNGLVLAADGKKMSKRLQNYPSPDAVLAQHGADALRLYLINSPVVRAEPLRFRQEGVFSVVKDVFLPWYNAYRFLVQSTRRWEAAQPTQPASFSPDPAAAAASPNVLDRWVAASAADLARFVRAEMGAHRLYTVVPRLTAFIDELTNVYVRYNRPRLKGTVVEEDEEGGEGEGEKGSAPPNDQLAALSTLHSVLSTLALVMCPFTPFFCEALWRNLRRAVPDAWAWPESVHWADFPDPGPPGPGDEAVRAGVGLMQSAIELARGVREKHSLPLKQPLRRLTLIHRDPAALAGLTPDLRAYILSEANVAEIVDCADVAAWTAGRAVPDWAGLGARLGPRMGAVAGALKAAGPDLLAAIEDGQAITVAGVELGPGDVSVARTFVRPKAAAAPGGGGGGSGGSEGAPAPDGAGDPASGLFVALDLTVDDALAAAGTAREVATRVQKARKTAGLVAGEAVDVWLGGGSGGGGGEGGDGGAAATASAPAPPLPPALAAALEAQASWVTATLGRAPRPLADLPPGRAELVREAHAVGAGDFVLVLTRPE